MLEELCKAKPATTFPFGQHRGEAYLREECGLAKEGDPLYAAPVVQPDMSDGGEGADLKQCSMRL